MSKRKRTIDAAILSSSNTPILSESAEHDTRRVSKRHRSTVKAEIREATSPTTKPNRPVVVKKGKSEARKTRLDLSDNDRTGSHTGQAKIGNGGQSQVDDREDTKPHVAPERKSRVQKSNEVMPLASRAIGHKLYIGAHVSSAGGVPNGVSNAVHIGANAFALFLKSQRKWTNPALTDEHCANFHANCKAHGYDQAHHVVPHGSYLVNLAHTDPERTTQAYDSFIDDLRRCERLGITLYNFHPGNSAGNDRRAAIQHLASNLNRAHRETSKVVTLLENMAAGGNVLGSTFEDLRDVITLVDDKSRVGVCIDTCHAFAAGYDLRTPAAYAATMQQFDEVVGFQYVRAMHLNDSKAPLGSGRDLHANIGTGFIGLRGFYNIMNDDRLRGLPLVLETPIQVLDDDGVQIKDEKGKDREDRGIWAGEIKLLESLTTIKIDDKEFLALEERLARRGAPERNRLSEQQQRKAEKAEKKLAAVAKKGSRKARARSRQSSESLSPSETS